MLNSGEALSAQIRVYLLERLNRAMARNRSWKDVRQYIRGISQYHMLLDLSESVSICFCDQESLGITRLTEGEMRRLEVLEVVHCGSFTLESCL